MLSFITSCNRDSVKTDNIVPNKSIASQSLESRSTPNPYNAGLSDNELKVITFLGDHKDFIEMVQNQFAFEHIMIKPLLDKGDAKELKEAKDNPQKAKIFIDKKLKFDYAKTIQVYINGRNRRIKQIERDIEPLLLQNNISKAEYDKGFLTAQVRLSILFRKNK